MEAIPSFTDLPDRALLDTVQRLAVDEREATASLIASLAEVDVRRLYLGQGCSSLFTWCTHVLHLSEHAAYRRIEAARTARRFPLVLERLTAGDVTLTGICLLRPHLTDANNRALLDAARHRSKRDVEHLVAALHPQPDVAAVVRKLPAARATVPVNVAPVLAAPASEDSCASSSPLVAVAPSSPSPASALGEPSSPMAPAPRTIVAPLAPERYKVQVTVGRATHDKLRRAQDLLRHAVPDGDLAEVLDRALTLLVEHLEQAKVAKATRPAAPRRLAPGSRRVPAAVRRAVWRRDDGQCAYVGAVGRCTERAFLEFHHLVPYARGGAATVENIQVRCRSHNRYEGEQAFGPRVVRERPAEYAARSGPSSPSPSVFPADSCSTEPLPEPALRARGVAITDSPEAVCQVDRSRRETLRPVGRPNRFPSSGGSRSPGSCRSCGDGSRRRRGRSGEAPAGRG